MHSPNPLQELPVIAPPLQPRHLTSSRSPARDRRATPRVPVEIACEELAGACKFLRITSDLSTFGLSTQLGFGHPIGTRLALVLHLPDQPARPLQVEATVVGHPSPRSGMRLAFKNLSADAGRRLHRFLSSRSRTFLA